jgi:hypothetical protein
MTAMTEGYEALRHQATGDGALSATAATPRGLALLLRSGVGAWVAVWRQLVGFTPPSEPPVAEPVESRVTAIRGGPELAVLLVEMALSGRRGERRDAS